MNGPTKLAKVLKYSIMGFLNDLFGNMFGNVDTGAKILPVVQIVRVDTRVKDAHMEVYAYIRNDFHQRMELDKVRIFGTMRELDNWLDPNESKIHLLYSGPRMTHTNYRECEVVYLQPDGDYFASIHYIDYQLESDKTYSVKDLQLRHPIRDV